jgi:hypothetical protein
MTNTMSASTETSGFFHLAFVSRLRLHFLPFCLSPRNSEVDPEACPVDRTRKPHLEVIVVDDRSKDRTMQILEGIEREHALW